MHHQLSPIKLLTWYFSQKLHKGLFFCHLLQNFYYSGMQYKFRMLIIRSPNVNNSSVSELGEPVFHSVPPTTQKIYQSQVNIVSIYRCETASVFDKILIDHMSFK